MTTIERLDGLLAAYKPTGKDAEEEAAQKKVREEFLAEFPIGSIAKLDLDSYCIGRGNRSNLCWWVERGTSKLSKYAPGSAKSYGIFWSEKNRCFRLSAASRKYQEGNPEVDVPTIFSKIIADPLTAFLNDHGNSYGSVTKAVGQGFLLKLLILYYPEEFIQINSVDWLNKIITEFGLAKSESFVENNKTVKRLYDEKRKLVPGGEITQGAFVTMLVDLLGLGKDEGVHFWHMQLHPTNGEQLSREDVLKLIREYGEIGMGREWNNDGGQPRMFREDVRVGDVIGVREGGFVALVRVTGECHDNEKQDKLSWFDIVRPVELLSDAADEYIEKYRKVMHKGAHDNLYNPATLSPVKPQCKNKFLKFWYESVVEDVVDEMESGYSKKEFLDDVFMSEREFDELASLIRKKRNVILTGAPGVGKTYAATRIAWAMMEERDRRRVQFVQFHQSYSYEDFICGYKPSGEGFELKPGVFYTFCKAAKGDPDHDYFFIIDEINRGNLSKIFGELLMLIEADKRGNEDYAVRLAYKPDEAFTVPSNLYIIGMMNTADRSLAMMDYALRRRFSFFPMRPGFDTEGFKDKLSGDSKLAKLVDAVRELNKRIAQDPALGEGYVIGHSYFCTDDANPEEIVKYEIGPTLREYWFDDPDKAEKEIAALLESVR